MNLSESTKSSTYRDVVPNNPKERQEWFNVQYRKLVESHIANLRVYFPHLPEGQSIVFNDFTDEGDIHVIYGKLHLYIPREHVKKATDWRNTFDVEVDGVVIPIESRIEAAQRQVVRQVEPRLRGLDQLMPPRVKQSPISSQSTLIQKIMRVLLKSK